MPGVHLLCTQRIQPEHSMHEVGPQPVPPTEHGYFTPIPMMGVLSDLSNMHLLHVT